MFNPIRFDTDLLMKCLKCSHLFVVDGDSKIGSVPCPSCGSRNMDLASRSDLKKNTFDLVAKELIRLQRKIKRKVDRDPQDYDKYQTLLYRWSKRKKKK